MKTGHGGKFFKATSFGETVNVHVVQSVREPQPDFDEMKRVIDSAYQVVNGDYKCEDGYADWSRSVWRPRPGDVFVRESAGQETILRCLGGACADSVCA